LAPRPDVDTPALFQAAPLPVAELDPAQRLACLRLIRSENVGPVAFRALINHYGGAREALAALPELARRGGRKRPFRLFPEAEASHELEAAERIGARPLFTIEPGYPAALAQTDVPPPMLYVRGRIEMLNAPSVAIVGSRDASAAGLTLAQRFAHGLGAAGLVVVSGLARGIDAAAHRGSLATGTVAVVAGGLDVVYPPEHGGLLEEIAAKGCLVSERPPGLKPRGADFPRRNRLIAGIARGVVVIEAAARSGSLVTARLAGEVGREVFALPGSPLDPRAEGTNRLLKEGATLVTEPADIINALAPGFREPTPLTMPAPNPEPAATTGATVAASAAMLTDDDAVRAAVIGALGPAPVGVDQVARSVGLPISAVQGVLVELALAGRLTLHGAQLVSLSPDSGS
jgi:DNA processing protein